MGRRRIEFFRTSDEFGFCSNFSRHPVSIYGKTWMTAEHAYQSRKFLDLGLQLSVWSALSPRKAADIGRHPDLPLRGDWDAPDPNPEPPAIELTKDRFMYEVVSAKFRQNSELAEKLVSSGDAYLVENTARTGDSYWGEVAPGLGKNRLGHILMRVRDEILRESE